MDNENIMLNDKVTYIPKISSKAIYLLLVSQKFLEPTVKIKFRDFNLGENVPYTLKSGTES